MLIDVASEGWKLLRLPLLQEDPVSLPAARNCHTVIFVNTQHETPMELHNDLGTFGNRFQDAQSCLYIAT